MRKQHFDAAAVVFILLLMTFLLGVQMRLGDLHDSALILLTTTTKVKNSSEYFNYFVNQLKPHHLLNALPHNSINAIKKPFDLTLVKKT